MIEKMNAADSRQQMTNTIQTCQSSSFIHNELPTKRSAFPIAVAASQPPCMRPWNRGGETFETNESPIGLRYNSATVKTK